jgi:hypothetical protein
MTRASQRAANRLCHAAGIVLVAYTNAPDGRARPRTVDHSERLPRQARQTLVGQRRRMAGATRR